MGSLELEEEELLQMVHDFIESESSSSSSSLLSSSSSLALKHVHFPHSTTYFTLQEILRKKTGEERRIEESVRKHMINRMEIEKRSGVVQEWLVKCLKLDGFHASLCHTSWVTTTSCPCGNYKYMEVMIEDAMENYQRIIVDMEFESQFEVARPTQRYKELTSKLPKIFVGSEEKLRRIITILCSAAEESLKERGLHIPPWRRPNYLHSKWKLTTGTINHKDIQNKIDIYPKSRGIVAPRFREWVPQDVIINGRKRDKGGGSNLSNQFSNMGINCC